MTMRLSRRRSIARLVLPTAAAVFLAAACRSGSSAPEVAVSGDTWAVVDGRQIMREDVDIALRRAQGGTQSLSAEELSAARRACSTS
jgi:hypothetical protein